MISLLSKGELQVKTIISYHFTSVRMAIIKKSTKINAGEGVEKRETSCTVGGKTTMENSMEIPLKKKLGIKLPYDPEIPLWAYALREP